jgi:CRISPR type I-E-associated protein CasB/Cse2
VSEKDRKTQKEFAAEFVHNAQELLKTDKGRRAALKRAAGKNMAAAGGNALTAFYQLRGIPNFSMQEEKCFAVVCMMCLWDASVWGKGEPLIEGARRKVPSENREGFEKRLQALLDLSWDEDGYFLAKLIRLVKFCKSKDIVVEPASLLADLLGWEHDSHFVQKRWVKDFYHFESKETDEVKESKTEK